MDPNGFFAMPYPSGWQVSTNPEENVALFTPPEQVDPDYPLSVKVFAQATHSTERDPSAEEARELLEAWLSENLSDEYKPYGTGDTKVDKQSAGVIDFGRPIEGGYEAGRVVLVYAPGYAILFLGSARQETWDDFLPTFRRILADFQFFPQP